VSDPWEPIAKGGAVFVFDASALPPDTLPDGFDYLLVLEQPDGEGASMGIAAHDLGNLKLLVTSLAPASITISRAVANPSRIAAALHDADFALH
jgi:hypothetical protein